MWLSTTPTHPSLALDDHSFSVGCLLRLGLSPHNELPSTCKCEARLDTLSTPFHYLSCKNLISKAISTRHNMVVKALALIAQQANILITLEPRNNHLPLQNLNRPDLRLDFPRGPSLFTDVSLVNPASDTYIADLLPRKLCEAIRSPTTSRASPPSPPKCRTLSSGAPTTRTLSTLLTLISRMPPSSPLSSQPLGAGPLTRSLSLTTSRDTLFLSLSSPPLSPSAHSLFAPSPARFNAAMRPLCGRDNFMPAVWAGTGLSFRP